MYKFKSGQVMPFITKSGFSETILRKDNFKNLDNDIKKEINIEKNINVFDEFFINASHELRTPLNIIYGAVQLLEIYVKSGENISVEIAANINWIKRNNFRLMRTINNILDLHKAESGLLNLNYSYVNIVEVVENVVQAVSEKFNSKQFDIIFDTDAEEKYMMADVEIIQRVLLNLISNAVKFSKDEGKILVNVTVNNNFVDIAVTDYGIGIDESNLENIFNKFGQVDKSISRGAEGSGIGLKLSKSLIKLHGGNINVFSKINEGSTFTIGLPCTRYDNIYTLYNSKVLNYDSLKERVNIEFSDIEEVE